MQIKKPDPDDAPGIAHEPTGSTATDEKRTGWFRLLLTIFFVLFYSGYLILLAFTGDSIGGPVLLYVILAGMLGAAVDFPNHIPLISEQRDFLSLCALFVWKIMLAGILAVFVYTLFAAGMLQGALFPKFQNGQDNGHFIKIQDFLRDLKPLTNMDMAKVLVWSFIAGYSEKFVSGIIPRVESDSKTRDSSSTATTTHESK
jgi:hypothetical protein